MSSRNRTMRIQPVAVVRSSLVFNSITGVAAAEAMSFSEVLVNAVRAPRAVEDSRARKSELRSEAQSQEIAARVPASIQQYKNSTDLYEQLDTMLREKSMLIAVV